MAIDKDVDRHVDDVLDELATSDSKTLTVYARARNSAVKLIAEQGFEATSVRAIAKGAGVSAGVVQHHFPTKAALREEITKYAGRVVRETLTVADPERLVELAREQDRIWRVLARGVADGDASAIAIFDTIVTLHGLDTAVRVLGEVLFAPAIERHRRRSETRHRRDA